MLVFTENKPTVMTSKDDVLKSLGHQMIEGFGMGKYLEQSHCDCNFSCDCSWEWYLTDKDSEGRADIEILRKNCSSELWSELTKNIESDNRGVFSVVDFHTEEPYQSSRTLNPSTLLCGFTLKFTADRDCLYGTADDWSWHSELAIAFTLNDSIKLNNTN